MEPRPFDGCGTPVAVGRLEPTATPVVTLDNTQPDKIQVGIEVALVATSTAPLEEVRQRLQQLLSRNTLRLREGQLPLPHGEDDFLDKHIHDVCITTDGLADSHIGRSFFSWELDLCIRQAAAACSSFAQTNACSMRRHQLANMRPSLLVHRVFQLAEGPPDEDDACQGEACSFREWALPSAHFHRVQQSASRPCDCVSLDSVHQLC